MRDNRLARAVSIVGHPIIVLPGSALVVSARDGLPVQSFAIVLIMTTIGLALIFWARRKVRRGAWEHVDASRPAERRQWNGAVLTVLVLAAALCFTVDPYAAVVIGAAALIILTAMLLSARLKLSQHMAFVALATVIVAFRDPALAAALVVFAFLIAWSRLALDRHTFLEVIAGAITGVLAGVIALGTIAMRV